MKLYKLHDVPVEQLGDGITRQLITVDNMMLSQISVPKGTEFPAHRSSSEQLTVFVKGSAIYQSADQIIEAHEGDIIYIAAGTEHKDKVLEDTIVIDIFSPPRKGWLKK